GSRQRGSLLGVDRMQKFIHLPRTQCISMIAQGACTHALANHTRRLRIIGAEMRNDFLGIASYKNLAARREELLNSLPFIRDQASASARSFKDAGWRREAGVRHGLSVNVQHYA